MQNLERAIRCLENIEATPKRTEKKDLLRSAADNPVLRELFYRAYDWKTTYGLTWKQPDLPKAKAIFGDSYSMEEEWDLFLTILDELAARNLTGQEALDTITRFMRAIDPNRAQWYGRVLNRNLQIGANVNTFGEIWPELASNFGVSLAEKFKDHHMGIQFPVACEPKYDGLRITMVFTDGKGVAKTRSGKEYNEVLKHIIDELAPKVVNGAVDGEIYADWEAKGPLSTYGGKKYKSPWGKTSAMLKTGTYQGIFTPNRVNSDMWKELQGELKFWAFDYISLDVYDPKIAMDRTPHRERRANLVELVASLGPDASTIVMPQVICNDHEELTDTHAEFMSQNHEGSMIKDLNSPYLPSRSPVMLKRKEEEFIDGVILEVLPGTEGKRNEHWAGRYRVRLSNGIETRCNVRGDANRQDHWNRRDELVGTIIEMTQQKDAYAVGDAARFPVFIRLRDDLPKVEV
jgi:ATP-dependent DNA ligase